MSLQIKLNEWVANINTKIWNIISPFDTNCKEYKKWVDDNDRLPVSGSANKIENKWGHWRCKMKCKKKENKLSESEIKRLEQIDGWKWEEDDPFYKSLNDLKKWIKKRKNKKFPKLCSKNKLERKLATWASHMRDKKREIICRRKK